MLLSRRLCLLATAALVSGCRPTMAPVASATRHRVVVVGAGLSGLYIAHDLSKRNLDVMVIEATERPGGRIRTVRGFREGHYIEAGATHVVGDPELMALIEELKVPLRQPPRLELSRIEVRGGERIVIAPGADGPEEPSTLSAGEQALGDEGCQKRYLGLVSRVDPRAQTWGAELTALDALSASEWLSGQGASPGYVASIEGMFPLGDGLGSLSALALLRELAAMQSDMRLPRVAGRIDGGADALPIALASRLADKIQYKTVLKRLEHRPDGATLVTMDPSGMHRIEAAHVVLTMPMSVLRDVAVAPQWSPNKARAIAALASTSVTRAWLETESQPWIARGESGTADTDLLVGRVRDELDGAPGRAGLLGTYLSGAAARKLGSLAPASRNRLLEESFRKVHPDLRVVQGGAVNWDDEPFARGAYAYFKPGQLTRLAPAAAAPEGVVHFAGCGTSWRPGFMHGAIASAKRVLRELGV